MPENTDHFNPNIEYAHPYKSALKHEHKGMCIIK